MKILVTGATGQLGSAVVETLLKSIPADQISVLVRKSEAVHEMQSRGLNAFAGSYDDPSSLDAAMKGIDKVLLISSTDEGDRMRQHRNVINAAKKAAVKCLAYTSRSLQNQETLTNQLMLEHYETEEYIKQSGLGYTIFRNALYMDVLPLFAGKQVFEIGIFQPAGQGRVAFALRKEMGEAAANVLLEQGCENNIYSFTGSWAYSFDDVAGALSELSGKEVRYTSVDVPAFKEKMKAAGLPEHMIQKIVDFNTDVKNNQEAVVTAHLEEKLGRKPVGLKEGLKLLFKL